MYGIQYYFDSSKELLAAALKKERRAKQQDRPRGSDGACWETWLRPDTRLEHDGEHTRSQSSVDCKGIWPVFWHQYTCNPLQALS
jgi:hypothetical protein